MQVFFSDKVPYFLTLLVALMIYEINATIDQLSAAPVVSYRIYCEKKEAVNGIQASLLSVEIENLSKASLIKNMLVDVKYPAALVDSNIVLSEPEIITIAPAAILPDSAAKNVALRMNSFSIPELQPNGRYILQMKASYSVKELAMPNVYVKSETPVSFRPVADLSVRLIRNQLFLNVSLLIGSALALVCYLFAYNRKVKKLKQPPCDIIY